MHPTASQAQRADSAAIAAILHDSQDEPLRNKATRIAHEVLKQVPGIVGQHGKIMMTSLARYSGKSYVACSNHAYTVLFMGKHAFVLGREEGGNIPWVSNERMNVPDMTYFKCRVLLDGGLSEHLLAYVEALMQDQRAAVAAALAPEEEPCDAPSC